MLAEVQAFLLRCNVVVCLLVVSMLFEHEASIMNGKFVYLEAEIMFFIELAV